MSDEIQNLFRYHDAVWRGEQVALVQRGVALGWIKTPPAMDPVYVATSRGQRPRRYNKNPRDAGMRDGV